MRFLSLAFAALLSLSISAQSNWQPAVITLGDGTEMPGSIDDRRWGFRFKYVRFKAQRSKEVKRIYVPDIKRFDVAGRRYVIKNISVNTSPRQTEDLIKAEKRTAEQSAKPMLLLVEGDISLYEYYDEKSNSHFFLRTPDGEFIYLEFGRYLLEKDFSRTYYNEANAFHSTLKRYLGDCPRISGDIDQTKYNKASMLKLFERYYACSNNRVGYQLPPRPGRFTFGPDLSFVRSIAAYGKIDPAAIFFSGLSNWGPMIGAHGRYTFRGLSSDVAIRFGAQYHSFSIEQSKLADQEPVPGVSNTEEFFFKERSIHLQLGPEATLIRSRYPVFLESSVHYHHLLEYRESRFNQTIDAGNITTNGLAYDFSGTGAFSLSFGAGVIVGNARLTFWGSATRRNYDTYVLNLYRYGFSGSYDL